MGEEERERRGEKKKKKKDTGGRGGGLREPMDSATSGGREQHKFQVESTR